MTKNGNAAVIGKCFRPLCKLHGSRALFFKNCGEEKIMTKGDSEN